MCLDIVTSCALLFTNMHHSVLFIHKFSSTIKHFWTVSRAFHSSSSPLVCQSVFCKSSGINPYPGWCLSIPAPGTFVSSRGKRQELVSGLQWSYLVSHRNGENLASVQSCVTPAFICLCLSVCLSLSLSPLLGPYLVLCLFLKAFLPGSLSLFILF